MGARADGEEDSEGGNATQRESASIPSALASWAEFIQGAPGDAQKGQVDRELLQMPFQPTMLSQHH